MATRITQATTQASLSGSPEERAQYTPDGTMWLAVYADEQVRMFSSTDGGTTFKYSSGSDARMEGPGYPTFIVDESGYAWLYWCLWSESPQVLKIARGVPRSGGGWTWSYLTIKPGAGSMGTDVTLKVFRNGAGWVAFLTYGIYTGTVGVRVARVDVSSKGVLTLGAASHGPAVASGGYAPFGALEYAHTGDGKTALPTPHLYLVTASKNANPIKLYRALYESGTWTWQDPITLAASANLVKTTLASVWDGSRLCVAWSPNSSTINFSDWDGNPADAPVAHNPPAMPSGTGTILGLSLSHDPASGNIYLIAYDDTKADAYYCVFNRAATTWSAWTKVLSRFANQYDGKVQLIRHVVKGSVDAFIGDASVDETNKQTFNIYYSQLTALAVTPNAPTLLLPASGTKLDLANRGATFTWKHQKVNAGDSQSAWAFRRVSTVSGTTTTEYWNAAAQTWSATEVFNPSASSNPEQVSFKPGLWTNGVTYAWSVRTRSATGSTSNYATPRTVIATALPVVVVTSPSGLYYGESTPLVEWTTTSADGQRDYQVRIVKVVGTIDSTNPGPAVWDSGVVSSAIARAARVTQALLDGVGYRAYVRITSTTGVQSEWASSDFTLSIEPPAGPLIEVFDEVAYETDVPRARLTVTARSNFLFDDQAVGTDGWEVDANCTLAVVASNDATQVRAGFSMTSVAAGLMGVRSELGDPPPGPVGEVAPTGPLMFPVIPGQAYTAIASLRMASSTSRAFRVSLRWYDADDGTGLQLGGGGTAFDDTVTDNVGQPGAVNASYAVSQGDQVIATQVYAQAFVTALAPPGAALARVVVEVLGATAAGEVAYVTALAAQPGYDQNWQNGGYVPFQVVRVERSDDSGATWSDLGETFKPDLRQRAVGIDRLMPMNAVVQYRAYTDVDTGANSVLTSDASPISITEIDSDAWILRDPSDELAEVVAFVTDYTPDHEENTTVTRVPGRFFPVVDTEGQQAETGSMEVYVPGDVVDRMLDLITRPAAMVAQSPAGRVLHLRALKSSEKPEAGRARTISIDYVEVDG